VLQALCCRKQREGTGKLSAAPYTLLMSSWPPGQTYTKVLICRRSRSPHSLTTQRTKRFCRSFATSLLGRLFAQKMRVPRTTCAKWSWAGYSSKLGNSWIRLYHAAQSGIRASSEFKPIVTTPHRHRAGRAHGTPSGFPCRNHLPHTFMLEEDGSP